MAGSCCPPALQPGCQTQASSSVALDPPILVCGCLHWLVVLRAPWADLCLVLCSCWVYLHLRVNSGVKDFFWAALHRTPWNYWDLQVSMPPHLMWQGWADRRTCPAESFSCACAWMSKGKEGRTKWLMDWMNCSGRAWPWCIQLYSGIAEWNVMVWSSVMIFV